MSLIQPLDAQCIYFLGKIFQYYFHQLLERIEAYEANLLQKFYLKFLRWHLDTKQIIHHKKGEIIINLQ